MLEREIKERMEIYGSRFRPLVFDCVDSTNTVLAAMARDGAPEHTAVIAPMQTAGRGRGGHSFYSPKDCGVYFSLLLRPSFDAGTAIKLITPAAATAAARAISELSGRRARIKWVNDILLDGKKVCGILTEAMPDGRGGLEWVIVGTGINVTEPESGYPEPIRDIAGAVFGTGASPHGSAAAELAVRTLDAFIGLYSQMPRCSFYEEYLGAQTYTRRPEGMPYGVDSDFRLLVETDGGERLMLTSAG